MDSAYNTFVTKISVPITISHENKCLPWTSSNNIKTKNSHYWTSKLKTHSYLNGRPETRFKSHFAYTLRRIILHISSDGPFQRHINLYWIESFPSIICDQIKIRNTRFNDLSQKLSFKPNALQRYISKLDSVLHWVSWFLLFSSFKFPGLSGTQAGISVYRMKRFKTNHWPKCRWL